MRLAFVWMMGVFLGCGCGAAGRGLVGERTEARLTEARGAFDEATRLRAAGRYSEALAPAGHALALRESVWGDSHPDVARCLDLMGELYWRQGEFAHAEPLLQRARALREASLDEDAPGLAQTLHLLGSLYSDQGFNDRAEPLLRRALALREAAFGKRHPAVASSLNTLGILSMEQGLYGRAETFYQRALALREAVLGSRHPDFARTLDDLAVLYLNQGLYGRAEPLLERALALREAALGTPHPAVADSLDHLATAYVGQGSYDRAEPLHQRALALREAVLGPTHPDVAHSLSALAHLRLAQNRLSDALPLFTRAVAIHEQRLREEVLGLSESGLARRLQELRAAAQVLYALLHAHPEDSGVRRLALSAVLLLKGRSLDETATLARVLSRELSAADRDTFERMRGLRTQRATLALAGPGSLSPGDHRRRLEQLAARGDVLETELARRSAPLRALTAPPLAADIVERVAAALPTDGALVEFVAYEDNPLFPAPGALPSGPPGPSRYLALVLLPDASTRAVDLGLAGPLDHAATRLRDALAHHEASFQATAQALEQLAFEPLRPLLGGTHRLLLSPDGQLGLVPFAALHDGRGFLLDSFVFTYLTSGRELLPRPQGLEPASSVVVLAAPDLAASPPAAPWLPTVRGGLPSSLWGPLPGTRQEAQGIQHLLPQARLFLGPEANRERLFHLPTPGILHLATHGFFLQSDRTATAAGARAVGSSGGLGDDTQPDPGEPLLRSGLVLASPRVQTPDGSTPPESQPGRSLITALELAGLDLWGTQLVVLSACDTGRGEVQLGQGVYGLRRAFGIAGAETVVMSLWTVDDDSTRRLMELYYRNLLAGQGRASALHEAMRSLRGSRPHPHDWAPFIALGSDAPLRAITPAAP